jgi:hypothetical protein
MKIDPVWLVAPPKAPSIPTRRAFLLAGGCFAAGMSIGGACGYSYGKSQSSDSSSAGAAPGGAAAEGDLPKSGDIELDQLRWLAVKAPVDELFEKALSFLHIRGITYPKDEILWRGVDRLSKEIVENPSRDVSEAVVLAVISHIESPARPTTPSLRDRVPALRARREQIRRRK